MSQSITDRRSQKGTKEKDKITDRRSQMSEKREKEKRVRTGKGEKGCFWCFRQKVLQEKESRERERER